MTKVKSVVVSRRTCALISRQLRLGEFLFMGKGMEHRGEVPPNLLADVYEALVAAIYLDGGIEDAKPFILRYLAPVIERVAAAAHGGNFQSALQEVAQRQFGHTPRYPVLDETAADTNKRVQNTVALWT